MNSNDEPWRDLAPKLAAAMEKEDEAIDDDAITQSDLDEAFTEGWGEAIYQHKESVSRAISHIRRGDLTAAIDELEAEFYPKWSSRSECEAAYREAMGRA